MPRRRVQACAAASSTARREWVGCVEKLQAERRLTWELERLKSGLLQPAAPVNPRGRTPPPAQQPAASSASPDLASGAWRPDFTVVMVRGPGVCTRVSAGQAALRTASRLEPWLGQPTGREQAQTPGDPRPDPDVWETLHHSAPRCGPPQALPSAESTPWTQPSHTGTRCCMVTCRWCNTPCDTARCLTAAVQRARGATQRRRRRRAWTAGACRASEAGRRRRATGTRGRLPARPTRGRTPSWRPHWNGALPHLAQSGQTSDPWWPACLLSRQAASPSQGMCFVAVTRALSRGAGMSWTRAQASGGAMWRAWTRLSACCERTSCPCSCQTSFTASAARSRRASPAVRARHAGPTPALSLSRPCRAC